MTKEVFHKLRQKDYEFKAIMGDIVRSTAKRKIRKVEERSGCGESTL